MRCREITNMQVPRIITSLLIAVTAVEACAQQTNSEPKPIQQITLTGRVERVYTSEKLPPQSPPSFLIAAEVLVTSVTTPPPVDVTSGQRLFVKIATPNRTPEGIEMIPDRGDVIEFNLRGRDGVFEAARDGYRVIFPGRYQSESIGLRMNLIPPGTFQMGSPLNELERRIDESQHAVTITKPFYIGIHEVTQFEYNQVTQSRPSAFSTSGSAKDKVLKLVTDQFPVENISWFDAVRFCNRLSEKDGLPAYYKIEPVPVTDAANAPQKWTTTNNGGNGYRLPTEAEWEYACRAGTRTPFHFGLEQLITSGNMRAPMVAAGYGAAPKWPEVGRTTKAGTYPPNDWGLFDMHGNVAEWCEDWYEKQYFTESGTEDPHGPPLGIHRVLRGGSGMLPGSNCRSAARAFHVPQEEKYFSGFRVVRNP